MREVSLLKIKPQNRTIDSSGSWKNFWAFLRHAKLCWPWIAVSIVVGCVYYFTVSVLPGSTAALLTGAGALSKEALWNAILSYISLLLAQIAVLVCSLFAEVKSVRSARNAVWQRMMGIQSSYYDKKSAGTMLSAVTSDTEQTIALMIQLVVLVPGIITYLVRSFTQIGGYNPKLFLAVLVLIPVYIVYAIFMGRWQYKVGRRIQMKIGGLTGFLTERIRNLKLIKSFVTEQKEEENGTDAAKDLYRANLESTRLNSIVVVYTMLTEVVGIVIAVIWGSILLKNGEITLEQWLAFFLFVPTINTTIRQLTSAWASLKEVQGRASRLGELMEAPQESLHETAPFDVPHKEIVFHDVSFSYTEGTPILKNINITIPEGRTTAIVGPSGSGKTTMIRLIESLYLPDTGYITVGGRKFDELNLAAWRDHISYVNQDAELFSGTVREVLTYGIRREVSDEELIRVTKTAEIYDYIFNKLGGLDAELAIWGSAMSGGQRQRMVIARELLKNADVLILDEPTSALDAETATAISDTFFNGFKGKTIITITHELNFISHADNIIVLKQGTVEGSGRHETLLEQCPTYRKLVEEQSYQEVFVQ